MSNSAGPSGSHPDGVSRQPTGVPSDRAKEILGSIDFYKVGHHGSTNATNPTAPSQFKVEAIVRRNLDRLDERRTFDACLVLNHTPQEQGTATVVGPEDAFIGSLDELLLQMQEINNLLSKVANSKEYSKGLRSPANTELLCDLAQEGNILYRKIVLRQIDKNSAATALRDGERLQIVSAKPDAIVPLEFIYQYLPPKDDAKICQNAELALKDGKCPSSCIPTDSPAPTVCPLGFWGLRKVIERHMHGSNLQAGAVVKTDGADPMPGRDVLALQGNSLVAVSKNVTPPKRSELEKTLKAAWRGTVSPVSKWTEWRDTVKAKKPVLLLALPHAEGAGRHMELEISGDTIQSIFIDESYVRIDPKAPPIVLLMGCDVANVASSEAYARQIAIFQDAKAGIVLATVATVLGDDAATVAAKLVVRLAKTSQNSKERFGELLRQTKREAVAESLMVAMCLISFGDADWYLK